MPTGPGVSVTGCSEARTLGSVSSTLRMRSLDTMARGAMAAMKVAITTEKSTWVM
jgi:hypothetical protein